MKYFILLIIASIILAGCGASKKLQYNFESQNIIDSVTTTLQKYQHLYGGDYKKTKWFALVRNSNEGYDIIINENTGGDNFLFTNLIKKTNRFLLIGDQLRIPVIFDIDFESVDFKKITKGTVNLGGYYFKVVKDTNGAFRVTNTAVLF